MTDGADTTAAQQASGEPRWWALHAGAVAAGWLLLAWLVWALVARLDRWSVGPFLALLHGAAASAVAASVAARRGGLRRGQVPRRLLWALVALALLWVWFPPMQQPVGWVYRHVALFFLTP